MRSLIVILLLIVMFAGIDATLFHYKIYYDDFIAHFNITIIRVSFFVLAAYFLDQLNLKFLFASWLLFVALFDYTLNLFRGLNLFYLGHNSKWDLFWSGNEFSLLVFKAVCLVTGVYILKIKKDYA